MHIIKLNKAFYEIQLIRNKDIRAKASILFEDNYAEIMGLQDFETHVNEVIRPYYLANFQNIELSVSANPYKLDSQLIKEESRYKIVIKLSDL